MITGHPIEARRLQCRPAEQVAAADNEPDLHTDTHELPYLQRQSIENLGVDTEFFASGQLLATQLEQNALVFPVSRALNHTA